MIYDANPVVDRSRRGTVDWRSPILVEWLRTAAFTRCSGYLHAYEYQRHAKKQRKASGWGNGRMIRDPEPRVQCSRYPHAYSIAQIIVSGLPCLCRLPPIVYLWEDTDSVVDDCLQTGVHSTPSSLRPLLLRGDHHSGSFRNASKYKAKTADLPLISAAIPSRKGQGQRRVKAGAYYCRPALDKLQRPHHYA